MSGSPHDKITRSGQTLTRRVWHLIHSVELENDVDLIIAQGGFKGGGGASASAGTHDRGDVYDISARNLSERKALAVVRDLREYFGLAYLRSPKYGWTSTGPHIHVVQADSHYALSAGARQQVAAYNRGRNGLANNRPDPFYRPTHRKHFTI